MNNQSPIIVVGATSRLAIEICRIAVQSRPGQEFVLHSRPPLQRLERIAADLRTRRAGRITLEGPNAPTEKREFSLLLIAQGSLTEQDRVARDKEYLRKEWEANTTDILEWLEWGALWVENHGGDIAVITSVASDRAKKSNYTYGAAKAALDFALAGLRHRLHSHGHGKAGKVITIKPGPTRTPMTENIEKPLADPEKVARGIWTGIQKGRKVVYAPSHWRYIMGVIKQIPDAIWHRTNL